MTKVINKLGAVVKTKEFCFPQQKQHILRMIKMSKGEGFLREGNFSSEIIWEGRSFSFPPKTKVQNYRKGIFLFGMVRKDAMAFLRNGGKIKLKSKYPVNEYNEDFEKIDAKITGTDLNHAYWRIAYNLGIITKNTYLRGLADDFKVVRLAALSTLGKGKDYHIIDNGKVTKQVVRIGDNERLDKVYQYIRHTCYGYMQEAKKLLKNDFICYRTDCVYYIDSPQNRKKIKEYFASMDMPVKQLGSIKKTLHE